ncbi:MAG: cytochrome b/b6 domain-containing protein [Rhodobacter sp.]|nr:cytochrome b/b6 domain-containing protein [Rhodobacter sp.]
MAAPSGIPAAQPAASSASVAAAPPRPPLVWDPVVRLTHWLIALVVLLNAVLTKGGGSLHVWAGWIGLGVLVLRLVWGLIGPAEARFSAFPPNPAAALRHLGQLARGRPDTHSSHNPAGALMAYALWALLAVTMLTGLVMTGGRTPMQLDDERAAVAQGDWSVLVKDGASADADDGDGDGDDDGERGGLGKAAGEVHEVAANLILVLVFLHVAGVFVESRATGHNLLRPMLAGLKAGIRRRGHRE